MMAAKREIRDLDGRPGPVSGTLNDSLAHLDPGVHRVSSTRAQTLVAADRGLRARVDSKVLDVGDLQAMLNVCAFLLGNLGSLCVLVRL